MVVLKDLILFIIWPERFANMKERFAEGVSMPESTYLSPLQAADILQVHQSTVKRWVDDGTIPASKTPGGHRKIALSDLVRLVREKKLPKVVLNTSLLARLAPGVDLLEQPLEALRANLVKAIDSSNPMRVHQTILRCFHSGMPIECLGDSVIFPVMEEVGRSWNAGQMDVGIEHLATSYIYGALVELRNRLLPIDGIVRPVAIAACPEGDFYQLGNILVETLLLQNGWQVINIGANTPTSTLEQLVERHNPMLVCLTCNHLPNVEKFVTELNGLYAMADERGVDLFLGGQALTIDIRKRLNYHWIGESLGQFKIAASRLMQITEQQFSENQSGVAG